MYVDGVSYRGLTASSKDSALCVYWNSIQDARKSNAKRVLTVLRKRELCCCGCGGKCAMDALMRVASWSFAWAARGEFPTVNEHGDPLVGWRAQTAANGQRYPPACRLLGSKQALQCPHA